MYHTGSYRLLISGIVRTGPTVDVAQAGGRLVVLVFWANTSDNTGCAYASKTQFHELDSQFRTDTYLCLSIIHLYINVCVIIINKSLTLKHHGTQCH